MHSHGKAVALRVISADSIVNLFLGKYLPTILSEVFANPVLDFSQRNPLSIYSDFFGGPV